MPTSIKTDSLLAKDEPISNAGSAPGIKKGKEVTVEGQSEQREYDRETTLQSPRPVHQEKQELLQEL